ncbi:MAG: hypothetical protein A2X36_07160 [Elusimicrobia bacterium GWA2_69_24]|nr:MAG: hypothetical protein A2X36_07160 [Elusimicrobia bacterium GWA2_69_24]
MPAQERPLTRAPDCVADDWGMSPGVNQGILELGEAGVVRCVSLLGSHEHLATGLDRLLRLPGMRFSLHLNLTQGPPLSPPEEVPSLCGRNGLFCGLSALLRRALGGTLSSAEIGIETGRQAGRVKALGVPLTGVEGHHHAHLLPPVFAAAAAALRDAGIDWVRLPADPGHAPSFLAGKAFTGWLGCAVTAQVCRGFRLQRTLYLNAADRRSAAALDRKLLNADGLPVIVHPAQHDDLALMKHTDSLREERVAEFRKLLAWSRERRVGPAHA